MKITKLFLTFIVCFLYTSVLFSQDQKSNDKKRIMIGGKTSLYSSFSRDKNEYAYYSSYGYSSYGYRSGGTYPYSYNVGVSPEIGIFVTNGLALGLSLPFEYYSNHLHDTISLKSTSLLLMPFIKYYFGSAKIKPYLFSGAGYGFINYEGENYNFYGNHLKYNVLSYDIGVGVGIELSKNINMDIGLNYNSSRERPTENNDDNIVYVTNKFGLNLGFVLMF